MRIHTARGVLLLFVVVTVSSLSWYAPVLRNDFDEAVAQESLTPSSVQPVVSDALSAVAPSRRVVRANESLVQEGEEKVSYEDTQILRVSAWKLATTTVFWVGEDETSDNGYIHNRASAWDENWVGAFGGIDDPIDRCGYRPCAFVPRMNPYYVALPYDDLDANGVQKTNAHALPWYQDDIGKETSQLVGSVVEVRRGGHICYGEVRDVGPFESDDAAYVLGNAQHPQNKLGARAGLDVSPAMRDCLHMGDVAVTAWRFVYFSTAPNI